MGHPDAYKCEICRNPEVYFDYEDIQGLTNHYTNNHPNETPPSSHNACQCHESGCNEKYYDNCNDRLAHYTTDHIGATVPGPNHKPCKICEALYP